MNWIQSKVPDLPITNFTKDWNDGKAVGALVDAVAPGLCPDWQVSNLLIRFFYLTVNRTLHNRTGTRKTVYKMPQKPWDLLMTG